MGAVTRFWLLLLLIAATVAAVACQGAGTGGGASLLRQYEYEEEIYLALDGTATVYINASLAAFVNLRGLDLDTRPNARFDKNTLRDAYSSPVTDVLRVTSWRRFGRRFAHVRLKVHDIRKLATVAPLAWSTYELSERDGLTVYRQVMGAAAGRDVGQVGWKGNETVAVRLHLPARIRYHNAGKDNLKRGNILVWEQAFAARQAGSPLEIEARMDQQSILYSTLKLFAISGAIALVLVALIIAWVARKGRSRPRTA
jgi:hypothetical protein